MYIDVHERLSYEGIDCVIRISCLPTVLHPNSKKKKACLSLSKALKMKLHLEIMAANRCKFNLALDVLLKWKTILSPTPAHLL